jgi:hypothetical protein
VSHFFENADFPNGGMPDWGIGVGTLKVYFDDMMTPIITCPFNMEVLIRIACLLCQPSPSLPPSFPSFLLSFLSHNLTNLSLTLYSMLCMCASLP